MPKFTIETLNNYRVKVKKSSTLSEKKTRAKITVHMGTCGLASGAEPVMHALVNEIESKNHKNIVVTSSGCAGLCSREPMATVEIAGKPPVKYVDLNEKKIIQILSEHIISGQIVTEFALAIGCERTG